MKLVILLFLNALLVMPVVAGEKSPYKVIILDNTVDASKLGPHQVEKPHRSKDFPSIERRNSDFLKAGIVSDKSEDELDRDLLWISAKHSSLSDLQEKYPKIPKEKLILLMGLVKK
ncbi:hypothetical protein SHI21_04665 [Bacteriovorax sp. PP10]|uniref:Uncharacterized protein n=1 Tax=Bacteriovorax antarcticus TaxID=3088717 RepID=A0ABU5VR10_9BACT|nr:hypothetical protein [Bacteriovorax sp. PP10]MEA9355476.1 hypothetical protein [Bacteriovorax sp. PP10]